MRIVWMCLCLGAQMTFAENMPVRLVRRGAPSVVMTNLVWTAERFSGVSVLEGKDLHVPSDQVSRLVLSPAGEKGRAQIDAHTFKERRTYRFPVKPLPSRFQMEGVLRVGGGLNMVMTPAAIPGGSAEPRSLRLIMESDKVWVQGGGGGRNALQTFQRTEGTYPKPFAKEMHVRFYMDRNTGKAVLRMNGVVVGAVNIPGGTGTPDEENRELTLVPRSGFPQSVLFWQVYEWTHNAAPEAGVNAGKNQDAVWLQNGDVLACRVMSIQNGKLHLRLEGDVEIPIPLARVLEVALYQRPSLQSGGKPEAP